jgi:hypothetical protein
MTAATSAQMFKMSATQVDLVRDRVTGTHWG